MMVAYELTTESGIVNIKAYVKRMKGFDINVIPPRDARELMLFHHFAWYAYEQNQKHNETEAVR